VNFDRLENLIVALRDAEPRNFCMDSYASCGTPACVLGHYAARTDLQSDFKLALGAHGDLVLLNLQTGRPDDYWSLHCQEHFGLSWDETEELFVSAECSGCQGHGCDECLCSGEPSSLAGCGGAKTPSEAIAYIRAFIDRHKAVAP